MRGLVHACLLMPGLCLAALLGPAEARTLEVGPGQVFGAPHEAARAAQSGDTIRIHSGTYHDCAVLERDNLILEGVGDQTVLAERSCEGKAILVIRGNNVTVRHLTLRDAHVPDRNGAGIRAEGGDLTIDAVTFLHNENGLLSANNPASTIRIVDSVFVGNGSCEAACAHGVYAGVVGLLRIERSRFLETHTAHHIKSRALRTEVVDCDIQDGAVGTSSFLIDIPNGGAVLIAGNRMQKGPGTSNAGTAVMIGEEGVKNPTPALLIRDNRFANDQARRTVFVNNRTGTPATLEGNALSGVVQALEGPGTVR